jgi:hypothetical protein
MKPAPPVTKTFIASPLYPITPADLHRIAAAGKYHAEEDARRGTYLSVISVTTWGFTPMGIGISA